MTRFGWTKIAAGRWTMELDGLRFDAIRVGPETWEVHGPLVFISHASALANARYYCRKWLAENPRTRLKVIPGGKGEL